MLPTIYKGDCHKDERGVIKYNNGIDLSQTKRMYCISNSSSHRIRGWQGHKIEQRWFTVSTGEFVIKVIQIDDWENPSKDLLAQNFVLNDVSLDFLHVPGGCVTSIHQLKEDSSLVVFSNYRIGEINDEYRLDANYFAK